MQNDMCLSEASHAKTRFCLLPRYRKQSNGKQAIVTLSGTTHYLGLHGSKTSKVEVLTINQSRLGCRGGGTFQVVSPKG